MPRTHRIVARKSSTRKWPDSCELYYLERSGIRIFDGLAPISGTNISAVSAVSFIEGGLLWKNLVGAQPIAGGTSHRRMLRS